jgi:hypothetical protein
LGFGKNRHKKNGREHQWKEWGTVIHGSIIEKGRKDQTQNIKKEKDDMGVVGCRSGLKPDE